MRIIKILFPTRPTALKFIMILMVFISALQVSAQNRLLINATDTVGKPLPLQIDDNINSATATNTYGRLLRLSRQGAHTYDIGMDLAGNEFFISKKNSTDIALKINAAGNVGIGEPNPTEKLMVAGNIALSGTGSSIGVALYDDMPYDGKRQPHYGMKWITDSWSTAGQTLWMSAYGGMKFFSTGEVRMAISTFGNVGIGTTNPQSKLAVKGTITAQRLVVTQTGWADFVFSDDYQLPSLKSTEEYINKHKHLPQVPSASAIEKDGQDVGEMNKILLQKVEELTLHLIKMQKEIEELKDKSRK